jgi:hypothetical protein
VLIVAGGFAWWQGERMGTTLDAGLWLLAVAATGSAALSAAPGISAPVAWSTAALCLAPFAWRGAMAKIGRPRLLQGLALAAGLILSMGLSVWLMKVTDRVGAGMAWSEALNLRNDQPFGHSTYTAAFAVMAIGVIAAAGVRATRVGRLAAILGGGVGLAVLLSSGSRAGLLALAVGAVAGASVALPRLRSLPRWQRGALVGSALAILLLGVAANPRLRTRVLEGRWTSEARESNAQRTAMAHGALLLGAEKPGLGWGPGMVPHVFPSVRARVGGTVDNVLQVHHSPLQAWVTLGAAGVVATLLLLIGSVVQALQALRSEPPTLEIAALIGGAAAGATFCLFDHSIDVPAIGLLATGLVALIGPAAAAKPKTFARAAPPILLGAALLVLTVPRVIDEQRARRHHDAALDAIGRNDPVRFLAEIRAAARTLPDAPYLRHLEAGYLATGQPFTTASSPTGIRTSLPPPSGGPVEAARILEETLTVNPFLEYAHYNLGWLRLADDASDAERHFAASARLAPHRVGVYLGLGLARAAQGNTAGAMTALAVERVNSPADAFSPLFREAAFAALNPEIDARARALLATGAAAGQLPTEAAASVRDVWTSLPPSAVGFGAPYHRVRPGYGLLMGFPEGRPPADVAPLYPVVVPETVRSRLPVPGWVRGHVLLAWAGITLAETP